MSRIFFEKYSDGAVLSANADDERVEILVEVPFGPNGPAMLFVYPQVFPWSEWQNMRDTLQKSYYRNAVNYARQQAEIRYSEYHPVTCEEMKREHGLTAECCDDCHARIDAGEVLEPGYGYPYLPDGRLHNVCCRVAAAYWPDLFRTDADSVHGSA